MIFHPYDAITGLEGTFDIRDLPAGTYHIRAWHPILGEREKKITVAQGGNTSIEFTFGTK